MPLIVARGPRPKKDNLWPLTKLIKTHHLQGLFLCFQKIIDIASTVVMAWLLKDVQLHVHPLPSFYQWGLGTLSVIP